MPSQHLIDRLRAGEFLNPDLTDSEQAIVELLWRSHTTAEIADQRGTRYLTVAKQLNSIYRKAGVMQRAFSLP